MIASAISSTVSTVQTPTRQLSLAQAEILQSSLLTTGFNCILQMPTGSGKTWLAEHAIEHALNKGQRAIYLTPLRALADELCSRWKKRFASYSVGIFTGDYTNGKYPVSFQDARLLIMTPEKLDACTRHWRSHWNWLPTVDLLVIDEFHLLGDSNRGSRLEGALLRIMRLNPFMRILGLSATLGNRFELAHWLNGIEYASTDRPVPLEWITVNYKRASDKPNLLLREVQRNLAEGGKSLVFVQSRRRAEALAAQLQEFGIQVAHHHAGLDHNARRKVESTFGTGQLDVLIATATLEMGLNLPVRQVILYDLQRFDGQDFVPLSVNSVWQRAGRAGRPGLDEVGEVILLSPIWQSTNHYYQGQFEPLVSGLSQPAALAEQIIAEVACRLSYTEAQLLATFSHSLAAQQGSLPSISQLVEEMLAADMLVAIEDGSRTFLRATRLGHVAVRHMLRPQTVLLFRQVFEQHSYLTFLDLLILATSSSDCQPLIPVDFEQLDDLSNSLSQEASYFLSLSDLQLTQLLGIEGKRLLAAIHTALVGRSWTRLGDANATADAHNCYAFEVQCLGESLQRLLAAMVDLLSIFEDEQPPTEEPSLLERIRVLEKMMACGLDEQAITLTLLPGLGSKLARQLKEAGIEDVEDLALAEPCNLLKLSGVGQKRSETWLTAAAEMVDGRMSAFRYREDESPNLLKHSDWSKEIDPYRLRRALELKVAGQDGNLFRVVGGLDPHVVQFHQSGLVCDCPDYAKGYTCKHILQVRLFRGDTHLRQLANTLSKNSQDDKLDLFSLWWRGNR